ncbi:hypothetical protein QTH87_13480 [Variovorax sp. J22P168]|uniref:hypothetical protein n=1 Tax=Variovorax jilinensis TaxID=3053513 RepID=UPI0025756681|nr:hypothetical protein [Variovorax sp. J22P168]MDM0013448.1 hypothetical protein [Variovorax sp. J22P168]
MAEEPILEMDFSNKLEVTINNKRPVILTDLTLALLGVGQQFERFIENETTDQHGVGAELFVKDVRSGSIIFDLVAQAMPVVPLLWAGGSVSEWINYAKDVLLWLSGKLKDKPKDLSKQDLKQWNNILEPVAKDAGSQMTFGHVEGGVVITQYIVSSAEANAAQNSIKRELAALDEPSDNVHRKRAMVWYQTRFDEDSPTGNKAVIESISKSPVKVIFENNADRKAMLEGDKRFEKPWHLLAYIVDVSVQTIQGVPKVYTILKVYDEDTFDPDE